MASHFSTIGLALRSEQEYRDLDARALREGDVGRLVGGPDGSYLPWPMGDGVELWTQRGASGDSKGFVPYFAGEARMGVRLDERIGKPGSLDGAFYLWALDEGDETDAYPLVVDVPDFRSFDDLALPFETTMPVVCFAHELELFTSVAAFESSGSGMAAESLIPSGTFHPGGGVKDPMTAEAIMNGTIEATRFRTNPVTGGRFLWLRIKTLAAHVEVIADPLIITGSVPIAGGVAKLSGWLTGRPDRTPRTLRGISRR